MTRRGSTRSCARPSRPGCATASLFVHAHRERLYRISESLPRTLCHLDYWPKNLIRRPDGLLVLIDWSLRAAFGALGGEAGNLVRCGLDHFATDERPAALSWSSSRAT